MERLEPEDFYSLRSLLQEVNHLRMAAKLTEEKLALLMQSVGVRYKLGGKDRVNLDDGTIQRADSQNPSLAVVEGG